MLGPFATGVYNQCMCDINCIQVQISNVPLAHLFILVVGNFTIEMSSY